MLHTKLSVHEENRIKIKEGFNAINKRMNSLSETMLSFKIEILMYQNGKSQWTISQIRNLLEDIRLDLNDLTGYLEQYMNFMLNNNSDQFEDLLRQGLELQNGIKLLSNSFINMANLV